MKSPVLLLFIVACLAQWAAPLSQIWTHEQSLTEGILIRLKCRAPDPYDPLRGRFLAVVPDQDEAPLTAGEKVEDGQRVYAVIMPGAEGLADVVGVSVKRPEGGIYVRVTARYVSETKVHFDWPFERFYINERLAPEADKWLAENLRSEDGVIAEVRVLDGRAVLADLTLKGRPFREILQERIQAAPAP
ncbi:MAG: GDYXXLXY domain-containing protein [Verrucomicrobiaceae bacterium]|nr:GDYXXLXY domain-containing protein [Verrucomicrobiaceae bacterium]